MAKVLSLPAEEPEKLLLLAEYDTRHTLSLHTKASEPLSTVQTTNGPGFYSSTKPLLLAYHYASKDQGPDSGKRLLVYHRYCLSCQFTNLRLHQTVAFQAAKGRLFHADNVHVSQQNRVLCDVKDDACSYTGYTALFGCVSPVVLTVRSKAQLMCMCLLLECTLQ